MGTRLTLTDLTRGGEPWELGRATDEIMRGLPEIAAAKTERSAASGDPVDPATLREAAGYLDCNAEYPQWSTFVAAIGSANCPEACQIAHEFSEGKLDRLWRYKVAPPSRYTSPEAVDQVLDTMPPGVPGGVTVATIFDEARKNGCTVNPHVRAPAAETFKEAIAKIESKEHEANIEDDDESEIEPPREFVFKTEKDFLNQPEPEWIIPGSIPARDIVLGFGPSDVGKTFVYLDLAHAIAANKSWLGKYQVAKPGPVVAFLGERADDCGRVRWPALKEARGSGDVPGFYWCPDVPKVSSPAEFRRARRAIKKLGISPVLILIDNYTIAMEGLNENEAKEAGRFIGECRKLIKEFGCTVVVICHVIKSIKTANDPRGSGAIVNSPSVAIRMDGVGKDDASLHFRRFRIGKKPDDILLKSIPVGASRVFDVMTPSEAALSAKSWGAGDVTRQILAASLVDLNAVAHLAVTSDVLLSHLVPGMSPLEAANPDAVVTWEARREAVRKQLQRGAKGRLKVYVHPGTGDGRGNPRKWSIPAGKLAEAQSLAQEALSAKAHEESYQPGMEVEDDD